MSGRRRRSAGRSALLKDGDIIDIDAVAGTLSVRLDDAELAARRKNWEPRETDYKAARSGNTRRAWARRARAP